MNDLDRLREFRYGSTVTRLEVQGALEERDKLISALEQGVKELEGILDTHDNWCSSRDLLQQAEAALADEKEHRTDLAEALHSVKLIARAEREENERLRWMLDSLAIDHIEDLAQRDLHTSYQRLMAGLADRWTRREE